MARQVLRAELARLGGVSRAALTKLCGDNGKLAVACKGKWVDLDHPAVAAWLESKGVASTAPRPRHEKAPPKRQAVRPPDPPKEPARPLASRARPSPPKTEAKPAEREAPERARATTPEVAEAYLTKLGEELSIEDLPGWTLQELIEYWGTEPRFRDFLEARKRIAEITEKDLKNDETVGRLVERDFVKTHIFGFIDAVHKRLLQDAATNIVRTIYAAAKSGEPVEEAEKSVREILGSHLSPVKTQVARALRNA